MKALNEKLNEIQKAMMSPQLWNMIEQWSMALLIENEERIISYVNQSYCELLGISKSPQELIGLPSSIIAQELSRNFTFNESHHQLFQSMIDEQKVVENRVVELDKVLVLSIDFIPLLTEEKRGWYIWKLQNKADRTPIQRAIEEQNDNYWEMIDTMELGVLEVNNDDTIIRAYPRFCQMLGYASHELVGKTASKVLVPEDLHGFIVDQNKARTEGKTGSYELPLRRKNGSVLWAIVNGAPLYDTAGQVMGSIGIHYDNTERRVLMDDLAKAKKIAEDAQYAEKQFLANISHEIRTPLNAIIGMSHLLYDTTITDEQKEYIDLLKSSANVLQNILTDILDISSIESQSVELTYHKLDLQGLVYSIYKINELRNTKNELSFKLQYDDAIDKTVLGNDRIIYQILSKVISNAYKFTEKGTIEINVRKLSSTVDTVLVAFEIKDSGVGIEGNKLEQIFEKFKQIPNETGHKFQGVGLGLALVKQWVDLLGGTISLSTQKGVGTTFLIHIAFRKVEKTQLNVEQEIADRKYKVLVVDDNLMNRKYVCGLLDKLNIDYEMAIDGRMAVEMIHQTRYDLILMDIQMPYLDGYEATIVIRSTENVNKDVPIVALTASATKEQTDHSLEVGMNDFLTKPFTPKQFTEKIAVHLSSNPSSQMSNDQWNYHPELDQKYLQELYGEDWSYAYEMFQVFMEEVLPEYQKLQSLGKDQNWSALASEAHKLNPPLAMVGLTALQKLLKSVETQLTQGGSVEGITEKINYLETELTRLAVILAQEVNRLAQKTAAP